MLSGNTAIPHLVVGSDAFALEQFLELQKRYGTDRSLLLSERRLGSADLFPKGPISLRGQDNIEAFRKCYSDISFEKGSDHCLLLKEGKWKRFVDVKMSRLLWGEGFYTHHGAKVDLKAIFPFLDDLGTVEMVNENIIKDKVLEIKKEQKGYTLDLAGGSQVECSKLYWSEGSWKFYDLYSAKEELDDEFITFCQESKTPSSLYVNFEFTGTVTDCKETLFIPLSYTYDWGHFIGEFFQEDGIQKAVFVTFIDPDKDDEEVIAKKFDFLRET